MLLDSNIEQPITNPKSIYDRLPSEFGETPPPGYVSAYRHILPESVLFVSKNGLRPEDNRMENGNTDTERLLESVKPPNIKVSRMKCVYAYPDIPTPDSAVSDIDMSGLINGVLMEVLIDPNEAYVANAYWIVYVHNIERTRYKVRNPDYDEEPPSESELSDAKEAAKYYWESTIPYTEWLKLTQKEKDKYSQPEVLINKAIPLKHMRRLD